MITNVYKQQNNNLLHEKFEINSGKSKMVKVKDLEKKKNADFEDQIRCYQLLISSTADEINIKDDDFDTEDSFSEEEASTSDKEIVSAVPQLIDIKCEPETYTSVGQIQHLSDAPANDDFCPDYLSMYCDDNTPLPAVKEENDTEGLQEVFQCNICNENIIGFRYTCVQCSNFDLCVACETSGVHDQHYMLRIPASKHFKSVEAVLTKIRSCIESEGDPLSPVAINNLYDISRFSDKFKYENENIDQVESDSTVLDESINSLEGSIPEDITETESVNRTDKIINNKVSKSKTPKEPYIKKPLNAFMLFLKDMRNKEPETKMMSVFHKLIGRQWHNLTEEERAVYYRKAREERHLHMLRYPNWKELIRKPCKRRKNRILGSNRFKKCRATYGIEYQHKWCDGCKRKKKCLRSIDVVGEAKEDVSAPVELKKIKLEDTSNVTVEADTVLNSISEECITPINTDSKSSNTSQT